MGPGTGTDFSPIAVWRATLSVWGRFFIPLTALSCMSLLVARALFVLRLQLGLVGATKAPVFAAGYIYLAGVVLVLFFNAFVSLVILGHVRSALKGALSYGAALAEAREAYGRYLRTAGLLFITVLVILLVVGSLLEWGEIFYRSAGGAVSTVKVAVLIGTSTVFVTTLIALAWYGFFYSLSPLIAAYEKKGVGTSLRESRARVRGQALRTLAALLIFVVGYFGIGLLVFFGLKPLVPQRSLERALDPVLMTVFGPLWIALWYQAYARLTEIKDAKNKSQVIS